MAYLIHGALVRMIVRTDEDFRMGFALDPLVLVFTLAITAMAATAVWPSAGVASYQTRHGNGSQGTEPQRHQRGGRMHWRRFLTGLQLALSVPLLVGAGLLVRTVYNLHHVELGFPAERLLLVGINSRAEGYDSARSGMLFRDLRAEIQRIPGVQAVSFSLNWDL